MSHYSALHYSAKYVIHTTQLDLVRFSASLREASSTIKYVNGYVIEIRTILTLDQILVFGPGLAALDVGNFCKRLMRASCEAFGRHLRWWCCGAAFHMVNF